MIYRSSLPATTTADIVLSAQKADIRQCLEAVKLNLRGLKLVRDLKLGKPFEDRRKKVIYAFLNRSCELACAPVHLRPVETAQGVEMAWYTYAPRAIESSSICLPDIAIILGYESSMTETEARSRAMGW